MEQWIDFTTTELDAPLLSWVLPLLGHWPYDKKVMLHAQHCNRTFHEGSSSTLLWLRQAYA